MRCCTTLALFLVSGWLVGCGNTPQNPQHSPDMSDTVGAKVNTTGNRDASNGGVQDESLVDNNKAPVIEPVGSKAARYGGTLPLVVLASDPDNNLPLTFDFMTDRDVLPAASSGSGIFSIAIPESIGSGPVNGIVKVTDALGKVSVVGFTISVTGKPGASPLSQIITKACESFKNPIEAEACRTAAAISQ